MGIFDSDSSEEEVKISPGEEDEGKETRLRNEVESKVVDSDDGVTNEDLHRQNERIIELLEELTGEENEDEEEFSGDVSGVL